MDFLCARGAFGGPQKESVGQALLCTRSTRGQIAGERIYVPVRARFNVEREREEGEEEIEFQIRWSIT